MLGPLIGILRKTGTLYSDNAEALAGGRLHHHPTLQTVNHSRAQFFQSAHLGGNVVGLDVYVHAAFVLHPLDLHDGLIERGLEHSVIAPASRVNWVYRPTQRFSPEVGGRVDVRGLAVNQHGAEPGVVHKCSVPCVGAKLGHAPRNSSDMYRVPAIGLLQYAVISTNPMERYRACAWVMVGSVSRSILPYPARRASFISERVSKRARPAPRPNGRTYRRF